MVDARDVACIASAYVINAYRILCCVMLWAFYVHLAWHRCICTMFGRFVSVHRPGGQNNSVLKCWFHHYETVEFQTGALRQSSRTLWRVRMNWRVNRLELVDPCALSYRIVMVSYLLITVEYKIIWWPPWSNSNRMGSTGFGRQVYAKRKNKKRKEKMVAKTDVNTEAERQISYQLMSDGEFISFHRSWANIWVQVGDSDVMSLSPLTTSPSWCGASSEKCLLFYISFLVR